MLKKASPWMMWTGTRLEWSSVNIVLQCARATLPSKLTVTAIIASSIALGYVPDNTVFPLSCTYVLPIRQSCFTYNEVT